MLVKGAPPEVMDSQVEGDHLEGIPLLSASLAPGVKHVPAKVEVTQVGFGGAHRFEVFKHAREKASAIWPRHVVLRSRRRL